MATNTQQTNARQYPFELVHYLTFTVNYNDAGIAAGVGKQYLPAGALVIGTDVFVDTQFNAGTTNPFTIGTNAAAYNNLASLSGAPLVVGVTQNAAPTGTNATRLTADTQVFAKYAQTGTAATTGKAYVVVKFVPAIDGLFFNPTN